MSKAAIVGLSALLLVGLVAAVTFGVITNWGNSKDGDDFSTTTKAVQVVCQPTDYKEACFKSMSNVKSDDPKELVKAAFESAKNELITNVGKSKLLRELEKNPETTEAVQDCRELFEDCVDDFERSFNEIGSFELEKINDLLGNLKSWLSASITYQETCLDGFDNSTGDASAKVRNLLKTSMQMSSNGLAMVSDLSSLFGAFDLSSFNRRRLLSAPVSHDLRGINHEERKQFWLNKLAKNRRLLKDNSDDTSGQDNSLLPDEESEQGRRRLLNTKRSEEEVIPDWLQGRRRDLVGMINLLDDLKAKANVVVAQDGSGQYKTIEDALKDVPKMSKEPYIIYIKEGVYNEYLTVLKWMQHVVFVGDGPTKTRITNNKNFVDGTKTFKTATMSVLGDFFMAKDIGFENSAGAIKHQAVALRVQSDQSIFYNCHMDGYQDTLYVHTYRQYYRDCQITGTIDFIFGDASSFFQNCIFIVRKPLDNQRCIVTAQGRMERHQPTGIIIHRSRFEGDPEYMPLKDKNQAFLGRPWKEYSKTIIMESYIGDLIAPQGWLPWEGNFGLDTCYYGEYMNEGPGSDMTQRVKWRGIKTIGHTRADNFMPPLLFETDAWIIDSGVPYDPDLFSSAPGPYGSIGEDEDPNAPTSQPLIEEDNPSNNASLNSSKNSNGGGSNHNSESSIKGSPSSTSSSPSSSGSSTRSNSTPSSSSSSSSSSSGSSGSSSSSGSSGSSTRSNSTPSSSSSSSSNGSSGSSTRSNSTPSSSSSSSSNGSSGSTSKPTSSNSSNSNSFPTTSSSSGSDSNSSSLASSSNGSNSSTNSSTTSTSPPGIVTQQTGSILDAPTSMPAPAPVLLFVPAPEPSLYPTPSPTPAPTPVDDSSLAPLLQTISSNSSSDTSPITEQNKIGHVSMKELERMLMENEEIQEGEEEQANDDMSENVPDGDEPSPATVLPPTPAPSPEIISSSSSILNTPSPSPQDDVDEPEPIEVETSDEVPRVPPPPKSSSTYNCKYEFSVIVIGIAILISLTM